MNSHNALSQTALHAACGGLQLSRPGLGRAVMESAQGLWSRLVAASAGPSGPGDSGGEGSSGGEGGGGRAACVRQLLAWKGLEVAAPTAPKTLSYLIPFFLARRPPDPTIWHLRAPDRRGAHPRVPGAGAGVSRQCCRFRAPGLMLLGRMLCVRCSPGGGDAPALIWALGPGRRVRWTGLRSGRR